MSEPSDVIDFTPRTQKAASYNIPLSDPDRLIVRIGEAGYSFSSKNLDYGVLNNRVPKELILQTQRSVNKCIEMTYAHKKRAETSSSADAASFILTISIVFCVLGFIALQLPLYMDIEMMDTWVSGGLACMGLSIMGTIAVVVLAIVSKSTKVNMEKCLIEEVDKFLQVDTRNNYMAYGYAWFVGDHLFWLELKRYAR